MHRQLLNLIVHDSRTKLYSLCRLDPMRHLFHPSPEAARAAKAANANNTDASSSSSWLSGVSSQRSLPRTEMNFSSPPRSAHDPVPHLFAMAEGHGEGCVLYASHSRAASLYDAAIGAAVSVPPPRFCYPYPRNAFSFHVTRRREEEAHGLYVLGRLSWGETSFEVFNYGGETTENGRRQDLWCWERLPLWTPPSHGATLSWPSPAVHPRHHLSAAALVDDRTIFVSGAGGGGGGTYAFDTVKREWRHAGDWALPCHGVARYAPELGLWFGLTIDSHGHRLCAFDLSPSSSSSSSPPTVLQSWEYLKRPPVGERWGPWHPQQLVYLGSGRFCIATGFLRVEKRELVQLGAEQEVLTLFHELTVLTGVEVARSDDGGHGLQMINHKSLRYNEIQDIRVHCVL